MRNFPIYDANTDREYWISRAIAVVVFLFAKNKDNEICVLAVKRGKGTPDPEFVGSYCVPCGYLDYDETCKEAALRELKEETGLEELPSALMLISINDIPSSDKRQNVTFRYVINSDSTVEKLEEQFTTNNSEKNEVEDIKFIPISDIDKYKWAFNHNNLIKDFNIYV